LYCIATRWFDLHLLQVRVSVTSPVIQARGNYTYQTSARACESYLYSAALNLVDSQIVTAASVAASTSSESDSSTSDNTTKSTLGIVIAILVVQVLATVAILAVLARKFNDVDKKFALV
jgi:hypothetical protein